MRAALVVEDPERRKRLKEKCEETPGGDIECVERLPEGGDYDIVVLPYKAALFFLNHDNSRQAYSSLGRFRGGRGVPLVMAYGPGNYLPSAFLSGCADFMKEPWDFEEFVYRSEALCPSLFFVPGSDIKVSGMRIYEGDKSCLLGKEEFSLLEIMCRNPGRIISRESLARCCMASSKSSSRSVDMCISRVRKKLLEVSKDSSKIPTIRAIRGMGYVLTILWIMC